MGAALKPKNGHMKIESLIRRKDGTRVNIAGWVYRFKPSANDPRHVAEVENEDHIQTFLAIKEGYRIAKSEPEATPAAPKAAVQKQHQPAPGDAPTPPPPPSKVQVTLSVAQKVADGPWYVKEGKKLLPESYATKEEAEAKIAEMAGAAE